MMKTKTTLESIVLLFTAIIITGCSLVFNDIWHAAENDDVNRIKEILAEGGDIHEIRKGSQITPLHYAAMGGASNAVSFLLAHGADINHTDNVGKTALHAATTHNLLVFEELIKNGADVNAKDKNGYTPLHCIVLYQDSAHSCEVLLKNGAKVDARDNNGRTALWYAARHYRSLAVAEVLLKYGASVHAKANCGKTPIEILGKGIAGSSTINIIRYSVKAKKLSKLFKKYDF